MKRSTLLWAPMPPGVAEPGGSSPASEAAEPSLSTESLVADLKGYLKGGSTDQGAGAPEGAEAGAGQESAPAEAAAPAEPPGSAEGEEQEPGEPSQKRWPKEALDTVTGLRAARRELRGKVQQVEAERDAERQRAEKLAAELEAARAGKPAEADPEQSKRRERAATDGEGEFDHIPEVAKARQEAQKHKAAASAVERYLFRLGRDFEGVVGELKEKYNLDFTDKDENEVFETLTALKDNASEQYQRASAAVNGLVGRVREGMGAAKQHYTSMAYELMPALKDPKSAEAQEAEKALTAFPMLRDDPRQLYVIAALIEGNRVLEARAKRGGKAPAGGAKAPATPPALPGAPAALPPAGPAGDTVDALAEKFFKTGDAKDREAWVKATLRASHRK